MTFDLLTWGRAERTHLCPPTKTVRRVVLVSYRLIFMVVCWFALVFVLYFLRLLGLIDGK
jgi:hypothetical protein